MKLFKNKFGHDDLCDTCDGAGLVRCDEPALYNVEVCKSCNGHGVVWVDIASPGNRVKFDVEKGRL